MMGVEGEGGGLPYKYGVGTVAVMFVTAIVVVVIVLLVVLAMISSSLGNLHSSTPFQAFILPPPSIIVGVVVMITGLAAFSLHPKLHTLICPSQPQDLNDDNNFLNPLINYYLIIIVHLLLFYCERLLPT